MLYNFTMTSEQANLEYYPCQDPPQKPPEEIVESGHTTSTISPPHSSSDNTTLEKKEQGVLNVHQQEQSENLEVKINGNAEQWSSYSQKAEKTQGANHQEGFNGERPDQFHAENEQKSALPDHTGIQFSNLNSQQNPASDQSHVVNHEQGFHAENPGQNHQELEQKQHFTNSPGFHDSAMNSQQNRFPQETHVQNHVCEGTIEGNREQASHVQEPDRPFQGSQFSGSQFFNANSQSNLDSSHTNVLNPVSEQTHVANSQGGTQIQNPQNTQFLNHEGFRVSNFQQPNMVSPNSRFGNHEQQLHRQDANQSHADTPQLSEGFKVSNHDGFRVSEGFQNFAVVNHGSFEGVGKTTESPVFPSKSQGSDHQNMDPTRNPNPMQPYIHQDSHAPQTLALDSCGNNYVNQLTNRSVPDGMNLVYSQGFVTESAIKSVHDEKLSSQGNIHNPQAEFSSACTHQPSMVSGGQSYQLTSTSSVPVMQMPSSSAMISQPEARVASVPQFPPYNQEAVNPQFVNNQGGYQMNPPQFGISPPVTYPNYASPSQQSTVTAEKQGFVHPNYAQKQEQEQEGATSSDLENADTPRPKSFHEQMVENRDLFIQTFQKFHAARSKHPPKVHCLAGREIDMHLLYVEVTKHGGINQVIRDRKWKEILEKFQKPLPNNASFILRTCYCTSLKPLEETYFSNPESEAVEKSDANCTSDAETAFKNGRKRMFPELESGADPSSVVSKNVPVAIEGKFEHGYLVSVQMGSTVLRGVLYHLPSTTIGQQHASVTDSEAYNEVNTPEGDHVEKKRRRSRKKPKDPDHPKSSLSGYNFFFQERHAQLKPEHKDKEIGSLIGAMWRQLTPEEKAVYQARGENDKIRYRREMQEYKAKQLTGPNQSANSNPQYSGNMVASSPSNQLPVMPEQSVDDQMAVASSQPNQTQNQPGMLLLNNVNLKMEPHQGQEGHF